jgi:hypothetical protein
MAELQVLDTRQGFKVKFQQNIAEIVDGRTICDFGFRPILVDKAAYAGNSLLATENAESPVYVSNVSFDPTKGSFTYEFQGVSYLSDNSTLVKTLDGYTIRLRRFPQK